MCDLYLLAAEPSGDLQGAHLAQALGSLQPQIQISGVAGPHLREIGVHGETRMEELQVMGFTDVISALPRLYLLFRKIRTEILRLQPRAVVCIDYPGFNLRLERSLRRHGYQGKLIHYICPTVWAWGKKRIGIMAQNLDLLLTFFPFEKKCFENTSLRVEYVGHPLVKKTAEHLMTADFKTRYHLDKEKEILALFPGSRRTEILRNFPLQLEAARRIAKEKNCQIAVSLAHLEHRSLLSGSFALIEPAHRYDLMRSAHFALATSGTVTLELALFQTPTVVNFAIRPIDVFLAQKIFQINLPHYCIVNIVAGKTIFPELFGPNLSVESLVENTLKLWDCRNECQTDCSALRTILGDSDAARKAATTILRLLSSSK